MKARGVIVAAGYGTRFLPVTRCLPKEMLPLVDRPAIDFIVQEMRDAGIEEILVITSRRKRVMEDWFDRDPELEAVFEREGAQAKLERMAVPDVRVQFVRQREMGGTGDALLLARSFAGDLPVVVAFPDDLFGEPNCTAQLLETYERTGCSVLSSHDLTGEDVSRYGVLDVESRDDALYLRRIVEKPPVGEEPSSLISLGRYLYTPDFFPLLERFRAGHTGGEYYPMAAIDALAEQGRVAVRVVDAPRRDTGAPLGYLQAVVEEALARPGLGEAFETWLRERLG